MARQVLNPNSSAPNDKLGDTPAVYTEKINANFTEVYNDVSTGTQTYWFVTLSTNAAISHAGNATNTYLTNNANSLDAYNPNSKDVLWNPSTNKFDVSSLKVGDIVDITGYARVSNAAAQEFDIFMSVAEGTATAHEHQVTHNYYKTANASNPIVFSFHFIIENADELAGGARFRFASVQATTISIERFSATVTVV